MIRLIILILISSLVFADNANAGVYGTLKGKVFNKKNEPIIGAVVLIDGTSLGARTNIDGQYAIMNIRPGECEVVARTIGYEEQKIKLNIVVDSIVKIDFKLTTRTAITQKICCIAKPIVNNTVIGDVRCMSSNVSGSRNGFNIRGARSTKTQIRVYGLDIGTQFISGQYNYGSEEYDYINENIYLFPKQSPLSTFSIDVDAAAYSNSRRHINEGRLPPKGLVRIEEFINYFSYDYPQPADDKPFSINMELFECPWNSKHKLVHIGLQGKKMKLENLPPNNLVFLIDVSGSMSSYNKLTLVQASLKALTGQLREEDYVSIVVYAGAAGLVLEPTSGQDKTKIMEAIASLSAGGSTAGGAGIKLAYKTAKEHFIKDGNNRVILATDGDFNVGVSSGDELTRLIEDKRDDGIFLTVLGFGTGNYKDSKMEKLADNGNGNYAYIDNIMEAKKVLVNEMGATLFTIAKDVKLQIEFNPAKVKSYRLIGYENRMLRAEDFDDDKKDAGELGSGHTVTALYEIEPKDIDEKEPENKLRYQSNRILDNAYESGELMAVKFRYKVPDEDKSKLILATLESGEETDLDDASVNFKFSAAVAEYGLLLRASDYRGDSNYEQVLELAKAGMGQDPNGYRQEFIDLVEKSMNIAKAE